MQNHFHKKSDMLIKSGIFILLVLVTCGCNSHMASGGECSSVVIIRGEICQWIGHGSYTTGRQDPWRRGTVESEIVYKYFVTKITAHGPNKLQNLQMLN